ncbi:MAG: carboxypeptidase-like regulatory domain-containing protein [Cyclobacteriaceae bacterium]|nr:carboxypeptidase-like regulatory domain-containing protein [Cyclobacteriaceae bacterium]
MQKFYSIALFLFLAQSVFGQVGTIKGQIKDEKTNEVVIGTNVVLEGTSIGGSTDVDGVFVIPKVKAGKYNLSITSVSFLPKTITGVEVHPDQTTVVNTTIKEDVMELESVTIISGRPTDTDIAVITELKKADLVAVGISSQQIKLSQDRDAGQVIRRVPGVTIVGNRFVNVRGLSERYSTVMLNGIIAPSTEIDSKAFAFDLIPSNMIDRMMVYKSGSPELPGEFAGANINISTKSSVDENTMTLSITGGFRTGTTGQSVILSQEKGSTDWLGKDDGGRSLPSSFPAVNLRSLSLGDPVEQNQLIQATQSLPNTWGTRGMSALPDLRVNFDFTRSFKIGNKKLDNITSISYATTNQLLEINQNYYDVFSTTLQKSTVRWSYNDTRYTLTNRIGAVSNFSLIINPSNKIEFRNLYNQQGQNQSTFRAGTETEQYDVKSESFNYFARSIYSGQLSGKHSFSDAINFNWIAGYNNTSANQPDYRRIRSQRDIGTTNPFTIVIPPNASSTDAGRFYSKLNEHTFSVAGNLEVKLNPEQPEEKQTKLMGGFYHELKQRQFAARWMSYKWLDINKADNNLLLTSFNQIFVPENLGAKFILEEGTNHGPDLFDKYNGENQLTAGYLSISSPLGEKFRLSAGLRIENNIQIIDVYNVDGQRVRVAKNPLAVLMPFGNLSYNVSEKMIVRLAYSKTVNRPVFRELAPFNYYDFDRNADIFGNVDLKTAQIDNVDLSWELYPTKSEKISFGVFYKNFKDPIEQYLSPGSNLRYGYINAERATTYGVEAEFRKSLENLSSNFLNKLTFALNGALIKSEIELPASLSNLEKNRSMQGQSPYVANSSIYYNNAERGLQVSIQYNVFGKRIFAVGDKDANPNQYEMPRDQIDLTISKQFNSHLEIKFGIQDLLNQSYQLVQDSNRDGQITSVDETIQSYCWGQYVNLGATWRF